MASRTISTILNLRDNMSSGLVRVSRRVNSMSREAQRASRQVANMANTFKKKADDMVNKAGKFALVGASIAGAFALKTGLSESLDLEGYRMQLETATKDTKKAADIMKYSIDLANKTPFEGGELVEGASKLEAMGLSAKKWLPLIGDMAAATNKPFDQAIEAFIDSQTGELERLKEFGVTKAKIAEKANTMFAGQQVINNKGQIVDFEKFNTAMVKIMQERFTGGMEKQANTMKGLWSTVTGVTKSALAELVGMTSEGTIKQGSLLDRLKNKVKQISDTFSKWQQDGTIQELSQKFTDGFSKIYDVASKVFNFIAEHEKLISTIAVTMAGFAIAIKIATALKTAMLALQIVWAIFNGTLALSPLGWVVIGITAVVAAGYALWRNWDIIKAKASEMGAAIKSTWSDIKESIAVHINGIISKINWLIEKINKIPGINIPTLGYLETNASVGDFKKLEGNATGTQYWRGGLTRINENGGEVVNLPNGSKVIPADKSSKILGGITLSKLADTLIVREEADIDKIVNKLAIKLKIASINLG